MRFSELERRHLGADRRRSIQYFIFDPPFGFETEHCCFRDRISQTFAYLGGIEYPMRDLDTIAALAHILVRDVDTAVKPALDVARLPEHRKEFGEL